MKKTILLSLIFSAPLTLANEPISKADKQSENWGVGIGLRSATIPFDTSGNTVSDTIPLLFYQGNQLYLDGTQAGYHLYQNDRFSLGLAADLRLFDIPRYAQNKIQGTQLDFGVQATWHYSSRWDLSLAAMSDSEGRMYSDLTSRYQLNDYGWDASLYATLRAKSQRFNNTYYGLQVDNIGAGIESKLGVKGRTQIYQNLYAVGHLGATFYDYDTYSSQFIDSYAQWEGYLGIAMFGSAATTTTERLPEGAYFRLASGIATQSGPSEVFTLQNETDPERNRMTSFFYGHPLPGRVFELPIDFYLTPGYVYHYNSDTQDAFDEYVLAIKGYYTFDWSVRTRLGFAEGVSYSTDISHIERKNLNEKGYEPSKLMNYLDFSIDVNVGDVFNNQDLSNLWLGYSLHHRSGIFTTTSAFGRIKGGSDYNTLYIAMALLMLIICNEPP